MGVCPNGCVWDGAAVRAEEPFRSLGSPNKAMASLLTSFLMLQDLQPQWFLRVAGRSGHSSLFKFPF